MMKMRNTNGKKRKPVSPVYAFGMVWLFYSLFFRLSGLGALIKCALLAWAVSALVKSILGEKKEKRMKSKKQEQNTVRAHTQKKEETVSDQKPEPAPKEEPSTANAELDAIVREGRQAVVRIQELNDDIPDYKISAQLKQIEILTAAIIDQVEKKEDKLRQVRQFNNYYLPTTIKLLEQYVQLQNVGLRGENITAGMQQIEDMLDKVIVAFQKQLDDLFERDVIDITADIQVMEQMMASQGLTEEQVF